MCREFRTIWAKVATGTPSTDLNAPIARASQLTSSLATTAATDAVIAAMPGRQFLLRNIDTTAAPDHRQDAVRDHQEVAEHSEGHRRYRHRPSPAETASPQSGECDKGQDRRTDMVRTPKQERRHRIGGKPSNTAAVAAPATAALLGIPGWQQGRRSQRRPRLRPPAPGSTGPAGGRQHEQPARRRRRRSSRTSRGSESTRATARCRHPSPVLRGSRWPCPNRPHRRALIPRRTSPPAPRGRKGL